MADIYTYDTQGNRKVDPEKILTGAMLVTIKQSGYQGSRQLNKDERELALQISAQQTWKRGGGNVVKSGKNFIDPVYYQPVSDYQAQTHRMLKDYTGGILWSRGTHIISTRMLQTGGGVYTDFNTWKIDRETQLQQLAWDFKQVYPQAKAEAPAALGNLYNEDDYLTDDEAHQRISMKIHLEPIPKGEYEHLGLDPTFNKQLKKENTDRLVQASKHAVSSLISNLSSAVKGMQETLADGKRIHNSSIDGLHNLALTTPEMDFTDDQTLKDLSERIVAELTLYGVRDKEDFKSEEVASQTAEKAKGIANELDAYADVLGT